MDKFTITASTVVVITGAAITIGRVGCGVCLTAVSVGELNEFAQLSDIACERTGDFGPPPGCGDGSSPHNRVMLTTLVTNGTATAEGRHLVHIFDLETFRPFDQLAAEKRAAYYDKHRL